MPPDPGASAVEGDRATGMPPAADAPMAADAPFAAEGALAVLFDADCDFCRWAIRSAVRWDRAGRLRPIALELAATAADPAIRAAAAAVDLAAALTVVDLTTGRFARGGDAVLSIAAVLPGGHLVRPWFADRPFVQVVRLLYRAVAANRPLLSSLGLRA